MTFGIVLKTDLMKKLQRLFFLNCEKQSKPRSYTVKPKVQVGLGLDPGRV